jgi:hypothetical protein
MAFSDDRLNPTPMQNWLALGLIIVVAIFGWIAHSFSRMADAAEKGAKKVKKQVFIETDDPEQLIIRGIQPKGAPRTIEEIFGKKDQ